MGMRSFYRVDIVGSILDDYGYLQAGDAESAYRLARIDQGKWDFPQEGVEPYIPALEVTKVSRDKVLRDMGSLPLPGKVYWDFADFQVIE